MRVKQGVVLFGLHPIMRHVLRTAERIWVQYGQAEGVTITSATDGVHSSGSWHPYGFAVDCRTRYFNEETKRMVYAELIDDLPDFDIIWHSSHIHIEIGDELANALGVNYGTTG